MSVKRELFVYDGRVLMGWIVVNEKKRDVLAFDGDGQPLGRFSTFKLASDAIDLAYECASSSTVERAA